MCDAFRKIKTATWVFIDVKHCDKIKWSNKCLQATVLRLSHGHVRRHAHLFFNRRCANDVVSGSTSCQSVENWNAVRDFLRIHNFHIHVIEPVTHDRWEDFIFGSEVKKEDAKDYFRNLNHLAFHYKQYDSYRILVNKWYSNVKSRKL